MKEKRLILYYLANTFLLMGVACGSFIILNQYNLMQKGSFGGLILLAIGGLSTAISGAILSRKSGKIDSYKMLLKTFFDVKQPLQCYGVVILFLVLSFGIPVLSGQFYDHITGYAFFKFFFIALLFGGVEEIGWRYTFQPAVEKFVSFWMASIITFVFWAIWHILYFIIEGSILTVNLPWFLMGLFSSSFILGAIYFISQSLWLCVLFHALLNAFTQSLVMDQDLSTTVIFMLIKIIVSIFIVEMYKRSKIQVKVMR